MWFSEPDYKLGLDGEIVSSLEAIRDEIYIDTLDFLRGSTDVEIEEKDASEDTSRYFGTGECSSSSSPFSGKREGKKHRQKLIHCALPVYKKINIFMFTI